MPPLRPLLPPGTRGRSCHLVTAARRAPLDVAPVVDRFLAGGARPRLADHAVEADGTLAVRGVVVAYTQGL